jgi:AcrR family transcriptional regulator
MTERGYHETKTPDIARRAGVAEGTIYRHFATKQAMLNEIYRAGVGVFASAVAGIPDDLDPRASLREIAERWCAVARTNAPLARLVLLSEWGTHLDTASRDAARALSTAVEQVIAAGKSAGDVRPGAAATLAAIWMAGVRLAVAETAAGRWKDSDVQLAIDAAWDAVRAPGLAGHPPSIP